MQEARKGGIVWTTDIPEIFSVTAEGGPYQELAKDSLESFKSSHIIDFGTGKTIQVLYHQIYKRKVQIADGKTYIRMPLPIFNRMVETLRVEFDMLEPCHY